MRCALRYAEQRGEGEERKRGEGGREGKAKNNGLSSTRMKWTKRMEEDIERQGDEGG